VLQLAPDLAFFATIVLGVTQVAGDLSGGLLSDRYGRRPVVIATLIPLALMAIPLFYAMASSRTSGVVYLAAPVIGFFVSCSTTPALVLITESLPKSVRSTVLGTIYACTIALFGGTTQFVVKWLGDATHSALAPAWYMTVAALIGLAAVLAARETAPRRR
jgi:MHS family citrate/tricarballylate:H+ symporter-like MFS transporter